MWWTAFEPLAWSSLWVSLAAGALVGAASLAMGLPPSPEVIGLAVSGTWVVYNVDRLRDVTRDRVTAPRRTAFVEANRRVLEVATAGAGLLTLALAFRLGPAAAASLAPVAVLGFAHRRVKHLAFAKSAYLTLSWVCVAVVFPTVALGGATHVVWAAAVIGAAVQANAIASNVRDVEAGVARIGVEPALRLARGACLLGVLVGLLAPDPVRGLVAVPLLTGLALWRFSTDEGYGLVVVDGALVAGGLLAVAWSLF